jgi:tetratricopeptide (TPR) repeat protein
MVIIAIVLFSASAIASAQAGSTQAPAREGLETDQTVSEYERLIEAAAKHIIASDWVPAFKNLKEAMALDPDRPDACFAYGKAHTLRGEYRAAEQAYRKALDVDPDLPAAHYELARLLAMKGALNESLQHIRTAIALTDDPEWKHLVFLGSLYAEMEQRNSAEEAFDQAIEIIEERIESLNRATRSVAGAIEVTEIIEDTQFYYDTEKGEVVEIPTIRYQKQAKPAPKEWEDESKRLKVDLEMVKTRKAEVLAWMDTP